MCSGFPRTEVVLYHAMKEAASLDFSTMTMNLGQLIVQALDRCAAMPPVASSPETAFAAFRHAVLSAGGTMPSHFPDERIRTIVAERYG